MKQVIDDYSPQLVYHAAAYKHVPLMEAHPIEAIKNNVMGTEIVARAAIDAGASEFVLISTDKAVRPVGIMGMTKRAAEFVIRSLAGRGTTFVAVRFGNVLGSNGSVLPLFQKQIASGLAGDGDRPRCAPVLHAHVRGGRARAHGRRARP